MSLLLTHPTRHKMFLKKIILYISNINLEYYHFESLAVYVLYKYSSSVVIFIYAMMNVESLITSTIGYHIPEEPKSLFSKTILLSIIKSDC